MRRMDSAALSQVDEVLLACLEQVEAGRATPGECLARYPELRAELEPLLSVALSLRGLSLEVTPAPAFKSRARARLMAEMARDGARNPEGVSPKVMLIPSLSVILSTAKNLLVRGVRPFAVPSLRSGLRLRVTWGHRLSTAAASLVLALALASAGTVSAAQQALPGDALYPVKTASEQARLALASSDEARGDLYLQLAEARLKELDQSIEKGRVQATSWLAQEYQRHLAQAHALAERDTDGTLRAKVVAEQARHLAALKAAYERVPDAAKESIAIALAASQSFDGAQDKPPTPAAGSGASEPAAPKLTPTATPQPKPTEAPDANPAAAGQPSGPKGVSSPASGPDKNTPTPTPDPAKSTPTPQPKPAPAETGEPSAPIGSGQPPSGDEGKPPAVSTPTGDTDPSKLQSTPSPTPTPGVEDPRKGQRANGVQGARP